MLRILFFLFIVCLLGFGLTWLAERPGELMLTFAGYRYEVTLVVAVILLIVAVAALMLLWWLIRSIWNTPHAVSRYFRVRRRDRGYQTLSTGLIAAGAGDGGQAKRLGRQAGKLLSADQEPLIHLLDAQAAMLEGDYEDARTKFSVMASQPETRLIGLRGLYLEAERLGERDAARHYAAEAAETAPQLQWAVEATLKARTEERDWQGALSLVDAQKAHNKEDRAALARRRAVLLTAQAMEQLDADPAAARASALEANRLQPGFVPAAVTAARALFRQNELRRGAKVLEAGWKKEPHPEIASAYIHARPGDSTHDRLARARKLYRLRPNNVESELALARAALDAGELKEARKAAEAAIRIAPREGAFLLMADIEEAETGDQGRVRQWLARAVRAPRDPAWVADGFVSEQWAPASPVTGQLDAFEWRAPVERLGQVVEADENLAALPPAAPEDIQPIEGGGVAIDIEQSQPQEEITDVPPSAPSEEVGQEPEPEHATAQEQRPPSAAAAESERPAGSMPLADRTETKHMHEDKETVSPENAESVVKPPLPDDPGVDSDEKTEASSRHRLF